MGMGFSELRAGQGYSAPGGDGFWRNIFLKWLCLPAAVIMTPPTAMGLWYKYGLDAEQGQTIGIVILTYLAELAVAIAVIPFLFRKK